MDITTHTPPVNRPTRRCAECRIRLRGRDFVTRMVKEMARVWRVERVCDACAGEQKRAA